MNTAEVLAPPLRGGEQGADLRHVDTWLFDLDNTLYPEACGLAELASARITDFVAELTGLGRDEAHALQKRYLADYGLTLAGLRAHHGVDPHAFHARFHDLPLDVLTPDETLIRALSRLPGRRLIFTNADDVHAARVLERLGLAGLFDGIFHIASADFTPKPDPASFARMIEAFAIEPAGAAFFDDVARNLDPAAALGMRTVLVGADEAAPPHLAAPRLAGFLAAAQVQEDA
jgi:putative hydrolase of the HAD superfamily